MEGTRIHLQDRNYSKITPSSNVEDVLPTRHTFYHNQQQRPNATTNHPNLSIQTLELPENLAGMATWFDRWAKKKRPRLKPKKQISETNNNSIEDGKVAQVSKITAVNDITLQEEEENDVNDVQEEMKEEKNEIDINVQQLILNAFYEEKKEDAIKHQRKKKGKKLKISLSKPHSPRTVQVIKVDVTSNCSNYDDSDHSDSNYGDRFYEYLDKDDKNDNEFVNDADFVVITQKMALLTRKKDIK